MSDKTTADEDQMDKALERLDSFRELSDGWNGSGSVATHPDAIAHAAIFLRVTGCTIPGIFPLEDGGVAFEWITGGSEEWVSVDFDADQSEGSRHFEFPSEVVS